MGKSHSLSVAAGREGCSGGELDQYRELLFKLRQDRALEAAARRTE